MCGCAIGYVHTRIPILAPVIVYLVILTNEPFLHSLSQPLTGMEINGNWQFKANELFVVFCSWKNCWLASCILDHVYPSSKISSVTTNMSKVSTSPKLLSLCFWYLLTLLDCFFLHALHKYFSLSPSSQHHDHPCYLVCLSCEQSSLFPHLFLLVTMSSELLMLVFCWAMGLTF